jgi:hypothetical protein
VALVLGSGRRYLLVPGYNTNIIQTYLFALMGNILGKIARTWRRFQAPYLLEFTGTSAIWQRGDNHSCSCRPVPSDLRGSI